MLRLSMPLGNSLALPYATGTTFGDRPVVWHAFTQASGDGTQRYSITLTDITDLEDESELGFETTTGTVEVGGSVTGEIDMAHDADWFRVELRAGTTYRIRMRGCRIERRHAGRPVPQGPHRSRWHSRFGLPFNDDKSGTAKDSEITWKVPSLTSFTQDYFIEANTKTSGTGTYTIEVSGGVHITGTPRQGQTLIADTSMIIDTDGLTGASYTFQWVRVTDVLLGFEENIPGATGSAYVPVSEDVGNHLKVRVTYTDDAGNRETIFAVSDVVDSGLFISEYGAGGGDADRRHQHDRRP